MQTGRYSFVYFVPGTILQMAEVAVYCMSKAAMDMFTQCLALGNTC